MGKQNSNNKYTELFQRKNPDQKKIAVIKGRGWEFTEQCKSTKSFSYYKID